jgi:hypothetical protein
MTLLEGMHREHPFLKIAILGTAGNLAVMKGSSFF